MAPQKSKWWIHFTRIDTKNAKFKTCGRFVKTYGNTSNLKAHMQQMHPKLILSAEAEYEDEPTISLLESSNSPALPADIRSNQVARVSISPQPSTSTSGSSAQGQTKRPRIESSGSMVTIGMVQTTVEQSLGILSSYKEGGKREVQISNAIAYFICQADLPMSIVEHEAFLKSMKTTSPHYKVETRKTIEKKFFNK